MVTPGPLRIGVTIGLQSEDESLWINGIKQNALYLAKLFQNSPHRHRVTLVNTTNVAITPKLPWRLDQFPTAPFAAVKDSLDVLIELGGQIDAAQTDYLKKRGTRIVSYCCGPEYVFNMEAILFKRPLWTSIFVNQRYDELWVIPQVVESSLYFLQTLRRRPARMVPFVWDPMCVEDKARTLPHGGQYRPGAPAKRLSIIEPNRDVMKFCLYPVFIAERAYRIVPERIGFLHVTNADRLVWDDTEFQALVRHLDIVRDQKASFVGSFTTPEFLSAHTDIVISHQWGLPLNYMYLEVCWQGYALVHNAHLVPEIGYFYHDNDLEEGAQALVRALEEHDSHWEEYRIQQRSLIGKFLATNAALSSAYDDLLFQLLSSAPAP
jgi:hypothetical protein